MKQLINDKTPIGMLIKQLRSREEITQIELAKKAKISRPWLSDIEQGKVQNVGIDNILKILNALDADLIIRTRKKRKKKDLTILDMFGGVQ